MYDINKENFFKLIDQIIVFNVQDIGFHKEFGLDRFITDGVKNRYKECRIYESEHMKDRSINSIYLSFCGATWYMNADNDRIYAFKIESILRELKLMRFL